MQTNSEHSCPHNPASAYPFGVRKPCLRSLPKAEAMLRPSPCPWRERGKGRRELVTKPCLASHRAEAPLREHTSAASPRGESRGKRTFAAFLECASHACAFSPRPKPCFGPTPRAGRQRSPILSATPTRRSTTRPAAPSPGSVHRAVPRTVSSTPRPADRRQAHA